MKQKAFEQAEVESSEFANGAITEAYNVGYDDGFEKAIRLLSQIDNEETKVFANIFVDFLKAHR
jgi:hypothetical protein